MKMVARVLLILFISGLTHNVFAFNGEKYSKNAEISIDEARVIATKAYPGDIIDEELKKSGLGSGLIYAFKIKDALGVQLVSIDAKTGSILRYRAESYSGK
jgi:uncharacterized membrane protein YkoI